MTDETLINDSLNGSEDSFTELVRRYESNVAATVIGMLGNCPETEDVCQEVFIRFYKNLKNFRGESAVSTYLTRIAINLSLNELKRRKRKSLLYVQKQDDKNFDMPDENSNSDYSGVNEIVQISIHKLKPKLRSVIVLRLVDGYSTEETANILRIPIGTVLSRLARAQKKIKDMLEPYMEEFA